jgi:hypothetical protein
MRATFGGVRTASGSCRRAREHRARLEILGEALVLVDRLEDVGVGVHARQHGGEELVDEDDEEVVQRVGLRLRDQLGIGDPVAFELLEQQGVGNREVEGVAFVEPLDDRREALGLRVRCGTAGAGSALNASSSTWLPARPTSTSADFSMRRWVSSTSAPRSRLSPYQAVRDNLRVKEVRLDRTPDRRWIVCHRHSATPPVSRFARVR